jgi:hypothetical protein
MLVVITHERNIAGVRFVSSSFATEGRERRPGRSVMSLEIALSGLNATDCTALSSSG